MAEQVVAGQTEAAREAVRRGADPARIVGLYVYGSAVDGGLRPDSDLDLLVVLDRRLAAADRRRIVDALLPISGRDTRAPGWRPLEVTAVVYGDVRPWRYPPRTELQFGEWLRNAWSAPGDGPAPRENPDLAVLLAMARARSRAIVGPPAVELLDEVPRADLARATLDGIPSLLDDLADDTRNVLLTLARMWMTVVTGKIGPKDAAADWALRRLAERDRGTLLVARDLYRRGGHGEWNDGRAVRRLAERMAREIRRGVTG